MSPPPHRPRVLQVIKSLALVGGAEQLLLSLAASGTRRGHFEHHVAHVVSGEATEVREAAEQAGVRLHDLGVATHYDLRWLGRLRHLLAAERIDLVHFHLPYAASLGRLVARSMPARPLVVYTQHNIWQHTVPVVRALNRLTYRLDDADLAVGDTVWRALPAPLRRRTGVLVHGIPLERLPEPAAVRDEVRAELGVPAGELLVTTVANMRPEKGYEVLLEAARLTLSSGAAVRFVALGSGPLEAQVRAEHDRMGLGERFALTGYRADAQRVLAGSDLFVLASHHEGFPVAVMEALALGLPIVTTAVGDLPQVVRDANCGVVVAPGDPVALAAALGELAADPERRAAMSRAAGAYGRRFDIERTTSELEARYESLLARRDARRLSSPTPAASTGT